MCDIRRVSTHSPIQHQGFPWEIQIIAIHINIAVETIYVPTSQAPQSYTKRPHSKLLCDKWVDIVMLTHNTKGADNLGCIYSLDLRAQSVSIGLLPVIRYSYIHSQK